MKKFDEMNEAEQKAILLEEAKKVLDKWDIADAKIEWLAYTHNAVFLVQHEGKRYSMKIAVHDRFITNRIFHEFLVCSQLNNYDPKFPMPVVVTDSKTSQRLLGVTRFPEDDHFFNQGGILPNISLYYYLEGETKTPARLLSHDVWKIGAFLASFHKFPIDGEFTVWDMIHDYKGLFSDNGLYPLSEVSKALFLPQQLNIMDTVALVVKSAMDELGQGEDEFGLIHGDLLLKNILFHEGEVRALDFEYCGWGYYLYDLCPLLWQLKPLPNYKELEEALWKSYCYQNPDTRNHYKLLETLIAGRQVASMRWVAANQHNPAYQGKVASILQQRTAELQGFLETGILTRS